MTPLRTDGRFRTDRHAALLGRPIAGAGPFWGWARP